MPAPSIPAATAYRDSMETALTSSGSPSTPTPTPRRRGSPDHRTTRRPLAATAQSSPRPPSSTALPLPRADVEMSPAHSSAQRPAARSRHPPFQKGGGGSAQSPPLAENRP